jgi:hypothetical protein
VPPAAPAPGASVANNSDARLSALSSRIDGLEKSLSQTTQELSQLNDKLTTASPSSGAPASGQIDGSTNDRIEKLEQQVMRLEQRQPMSGHVSSVSSVPMHTASHTTVHKTKHHEVASGTKKAKSGRWILRAATSDEVWVAKDASTREIRPVHVGDKLEGIGTVTAIEQAGDTWVVKGTVGTIR